MMFRAHSQQDDDAAGCLYLHKNPLSHAGKKLRKVERTTDEKKPTAPGTDVASILKRRIAIELSDTESESSGESDSENSEWD